MRDVLTSPCWHGPLCLDNAEQIAARIERMLTGKRYAMVEHWSQHLPPDLRTSLRLKNVHVSTDDGLAHVSVSDTYGVWGVISHNATPQDAWAAEVRYRPTVDFEHGRKLTIEHHSISGNRLQWIVAIEDHEDYS